MVNLHLVYMKEKTLLTYFPLKSGVVDLDADPHWFWLLVSESRRAKRPM